MLKFVPLKSLTWVLLVAVLALTLGTLCRPAHADTGDSAGATELVQVQSGSAQDCPCAPLDHGHDHDGDGDTCDNCASCGCHASVFNTHLLPVRIPWLTIAGWREPIPFSSRSLPFPLRTSPSLTPSSAPAPAPAPASPRVSALTRALKADLYPQSRTP